MIKKEQISKQVTKLVEKNGFELSFNPVIEEFFYRIVAQCDWS